MKTIAHFSLRDIFGGLSNPVYTQTLFCTNNRGFVDFSIDQGHSIYKFVDFSHSEEEGGDNYTLKLRSHFVFPEDVEIQITMLPPTGDTKTLLVLESSQPPLHAFVN